ncbi:MAG: UDP-N-acetylmuramate dehydrogenase [Lachnospiraceae bacterium]|nr:UDP-N-acetylmuramate dehydrogenase [Lachnospiraceae bacterium]
MNIRDQLIQIASPAHVFTDEPMSAHTTFKAGGIADYYVEATSEDVLSFLLRFLNEQNYPFYIVGNGSNLLVSDEGYRGVIITLVGEFCEVYTDTQEHIRKAADGENDDMHGSEMSDSSDKVITCDSSENLMTRDLSDKAIIHAGAGCLLSKAASVAASNSLTGLEFASGIPGSMGGAIVMNAGAYGGEMSQVVKSVRAMDMSGDIVELKLEELELGYRTSIFKKEKMIVLGVDMVLEKGNETNIRAKMNDLNSQRKAKQPLEYPSAGSTFKRPEGYFAGKLIMEAGLRGYAVGGACVSEKHCGFIINKGEATATDIKQLMDEVVIKVKKNSGVTLEPEVCLLGF